MSVADCTDLPEIVFGNPGETKNKFIELLRAYLSQPSQFRCELLRSNGTPTAIRVLEQLDLDRLSVPLARVARTSDLYLFGKFLIADTLSVSISENRKLIQFEREKLCRELEPMLLQMGFIEQANRFVKFTLTHVLSQSEAKRVIASLAPSLKSQCNAFSGFSLEQHCAPLVSQEDLPSFLVPIQPTFAMGLLDRAQSAMDLFGGDPSVLLRWENVYYRKKSCQKMLRAPGRILWYVSGNNSGIVAISHLDSIEIEAPKPLFRKYQKFGILEWNNIFEICGNDIKKEIMALKFSRTFTFRHRISLTELREVFKDDEIGESLQSPTSLPFTTFKKLFRLGFPDQL